MQRGPRQRVVLDEPVPVHLIYMTAWVDDAGEVQFRPDLYGRDLHTWRQMDCTAVSPVS
jgi:murein L,D-transpeptidase YcbB/YkuD